MPRMIHVGVAFAGALGALARYWLHVAVGGTAFPWSTLGINTAGSFLLGLVLAVAPGRWDATLTTAIGVGFLGAFTTFSTFAYETLTMLRAGRHLPALGYLAGSVVLGVAAAMAGYALGRGDGYG